MASRYKNKLEYHNPLLQGPKANAWHDVAETLKRNKAGKSRPNPSTAHLEAIEKLLKDKK